MLIDTHAHLYLDHFKDDIAAVTERCLADKVEKVILPNIDVGTISSLIDLAQSNPSLYLPTLGMHPCSVKEDWEEQLSQIKRYIDEELSLFPENKIFGIGEIGLDYYWDTTFKQAQHTALRMQIGWAKELQLPIILHCRDAYEDLFNIVNDENEERLKGIFHCFSGSIEEANEIIELGDFFLGIGGVVTFKKSTELRNTIAQVPLEYLVLETDAPYLTPTPFRGKRNESSYVKYVAQTIADVKEISLEEVALQTSLNAIKVFGL